MSRVSKKELETTVDLINSMIKDTGQKIRIGERYGYKALDMYDTKSGKMLSTVISGVSTGEAQQYLFAMIKGIELENLANKKKKLGEVS